jgi:hypothetical protein
MGVMSVPGGGGDTSELEAYYIRLLTEQGLGRGGGSSSDQSGEEEAESKPREPLARKFIDSATGEIRDGYYTISSVAQPTRSPLTGRITWMRHDAHFEPVNVTIGKPVSSLTEMTVNILGVTDIPVRGGERIIAIDHSLAKTLSVSQDPHTLDWRITGAATDVRVYTTTAEGTHLNDQPPIAEEKASHLDLTLLWPEWKNLLESLQQDTGLTLEQKAAVVHYFWSKNFIYADETELDEQNKGVSIADAMAKIINTDMGICNTPAGGEADEGRRRSRPGEYGICHL